MIVLRDEDKPAARTAFSTPLVFSVHEAKGLEYENVRLFRLVSSAGREFRECAAGVSAHASVAPIWSWNCSRSARALNCATTQDAQRSGSP